MLRSRRCPGGTREISRTRCEIARFRVAVVRGPAPAATESSGVS
jgi:hypothetical protein